MKNQKFHMNHNNFSFRKISREVLKYPYSGKSIENEFLSEKICWNTLQTRKKIVRKTKRVFVYGQLICSLGNGLAPIQAIGLPILPTSELISSHLNADLSKKAIMAQVIQNLPAEISFTEQEVDQLYHLSVECKNNFLSQEQLLTKLSNFRGGAFEDVVAALGVMCAIIILLINKGSLGFQPNPNQIIPPNLQWLYKNNYHSQSGQYRPHIQSESQYIPEFDSIIEYKQIQSKYKHAKVFGISGAYNLKNRQLFTDKVIEHMKAPSTKILEGTFKTAEVTHYFNPETGLNVIFNRDNQFISGWKLTEKQFENMQDRGAL